MRLGSLPQAPKRAALPRTAATAPFARTQAWTFARRPSPGTLPPPPDPSAAVPPSPPAQSPPPPPPPERRPKSPTVSPWAGSRPNTVDQPRPDSPAEGRQPASAARRQSPARSPGGSSAPSPRRGPAQRPARHLASPGFPGDPSSAHPDGADPAFPPPPEQDPFFPGSPPPSPPREFAARPAFAGPEWDHLLASGRRSPSPSAPESPGVNVSQVNVGKKQFTLRRLEASYGIPIRTPLTPSGAPSPGPARSPGGLGADLFPSASTMRHVSPSRC